MTTEDLKQYPEFDSIDDMNPVDRCAYLLKLAKRYTTISDLARKEAYALIENTEEDFLTASDGTGIKKVTKTLNKVDVTVLKDIYPEIYKGLCDAGKVSVPIGAIKDMNLEGVTVSTVSKYAELSR